MSTTTPSQVQERLAALYAAIAEQHLFHLVRTERRDQMVTLHFRRRHSLFSLQRREHDGRVDYIMLHDGERARSTMLREMWQDLQALP